MDTRDELKELISREVIKKYGGDPTDSRKEGWIFDFRSILLTQKGLTLITNALWEELKDRDHFQLGGIESAAIPLVASLVLRGKAEGKTVNGFYIRKSRKKSGLYKNIEGTLTDDPIVLVDDLMNTSSGMRRQIAVLESVGMRVDMILTVVLFRDISKYGHLTEKGIMIRNIFSLDDFELSLRHPQHKYAHDPHTIRWHFATKNPSNQYVVPKSAPLLYQNKLYFGTDNSIFWCFDSESGKVVWQHQTGRHTSGKNIFSSPTIHDNTVYFGSYDGKLYALDAENGNPRWVFTDCEWIGSSPAVAEDLGLVFIGLEHGLPGSRGSVVALESASGKKIWEYKMTALTHASPLYIEETKQVCIGGNEGVLYLFNAESGELIWKFETEGGRMYDGVFGFSPGDIKLKPAYSGAHDLIAFGSIDGYLYVLKRATGACVFRAHTEEYDTDVKHSIYAAPVFYKDLVLFTSTDKHVYAYDVTSGKEVWRFGTAGRIFATPVIYDEVVYIGSNDGRLYELDLESGKVVATTQFSERITSKVVVTSDSIYVPTNTCELYALTKGTYETFI